MLVWFKKFFGSLVCEHDYELVKEYVISTQGQVYGHVRVYECTKCRKQKVNKFQQGH